MIRIRFHGRGGHGTKTASRIVGTAAYLGGYYAQDSPVYGAERRGAAVVAFARLDREPIFERGFIELPDLIVVADETLLNATGAQVLASQQTSSAVFINTRDAETLIKKHGIVAPVVPLDVTSLSLETIGSASALSAGLAAAAARMSGMVTREHLLEALREELPLGRLDEGLIEKNLAVAEQVFDALAPVSLRSQAEPRSVEMATLPYQGPLLSTPSIFATGNASAKQTGAWRVKRPVIDTDACTRCGLCFVRCPDGAIALDEDGFPIIDYDHCKGCMICEQICPLHAIDSYQETRAW